MTKKAILQRGLLFIPVFFGITLLSFGLLYIAPSDPVSIRLSAGGAAAVAFSLCTHHAAHHFFAAPAPACV